MFAKGRCRCQHCFAHAASIKCGITLGRTFSGIQGRFGNPDVIINL